MYDFYKNAIKTFEILIKALNGNIGYRRKWQRNAPLRYKNTAIFNRNKHLTTRRKTLTCNR